MVAVLSCCSYKERMGYEGDEEKRRICQGKHGNDFSAIEGFDWATAVTIRDSRHQEQRYIAKRRIGTRLHVVVFNSREEDIRIISLRKADSREVTDDEKR